MEQHPIPQQISSYQFKLVGDMTLKQFFQVAGGVIVSLIFYSTPLHPIIKWPMILFSAGLGAAMAFLPFRERPLEKWIIAFFRSIYSPTIYIWKKTEKPPNFYTEDAIVPEIKTIQPTTSLTEINSAKFESAERNFLNKIGGLWNISNQLTTNSPQKADPSSSSIMNQFINPAINTNIPQQIPTIITKSTPKLVVEESSPKVDSQPKITNLDVQKIIEKGVTEKKVEFSINAAPPSPPATVNTIVGQVMDQERKIIEGAILEIKDSTGRPVRALKSNKAGHFIIVTPLANGKYEIIVEKEGYKFEPVSFEAKGEIIPAIAIRGTQI